MKKKTRHPPAVTSAIAYCERLVRSGRFSGTDRLPSIHRLAQSADVSLVTMWKAVGILRDRGLFDVVQGKGIRVRGVKTEQGPQPSGEDGRESQAAAIPKWQIVKTLVHQDIINRLYHPGEELPSLKELTYRYHTSFITLKKSLEALARERIIVPSRRTFRLPSLVGHTPFSSIIVFTRGEITGELNTWTPWGRDFMRVLEKMCAQARLSLTYYIYLRHGGRLTYLTEYGKMVSRIPIDDSVLGFMVRGISEDNLHLDLLYRLIKYDRYIAVSDEGTCAPLPFPFGDNPKIQNFALATSTDIGMEVAHFLLQHGHRNIAFISPFHKTCWSINRLIGLRKAYTSAGIRDGIRAYTIDTFAFPFGYREKVRTDRIVTQKLVKNLTPKTRTKTTYNRHIVEKINDFLERSGEDEQYREYLEPLFDKALKRMETTAWVCANDRVANKAVEYLNHRKEASARAISIVSFDDTFESFNYNYSSYNFNISALVQAMYGFIVSPQQWGVKRYNRPPVQIEGMMIKRDIRQL